MTHSIAVVDRRQGGEAVLNAHGVSFSSLADITEELFIEAARSGYISAEQLDLIRSFQSDPSRFMLDFFADHPRFLDEQIALGGKAKERALLCIEKGYHVAGGKT